MSMDSNNNGNITKTQPPKPLVNSPLIYIDGIWQIQTPHPFEIPLPPTPKKGYRETLIDSQWVFVRK